MGCHPLSPVRLPLSVSLSVALCLPLSGSPSLGVPARSCLSVCLSASASASALSPSWEPVSEPSSLSVSVSPDPRPAVPSCGPGLSRVGALAVALAAELAPAGCLTWRGCPRVCLCACPCGCTSLVCTLSKVLCLEGGVGARGEGGPRWGEGAGLTSSGRRRWWLQVGLGTAQVPGSMGAQGHGWAAPRPAGGSEDRGPQRAPRPWAANALGRWARGWGRGGGPRAGWCLEGPRVGERQDLRAPHATLPPTRPGRHTRPAAPGPGSPVVPRAGPAECWPGVTGDGGRGAGRRGPATGPPAVRSRVVQLKCSARSVESWRAAAAGWPDRQVRAKGRRSAGLLGRLAAAASVYGHTTLNAPDLV